MVVTAFRHTRRMDRQPGGSRTKPTRKEIYARIDRLAAGQHGIVTYAQLTALGLGAGAIAWLMASGRTVAVRRGVYRLCGAAPSWTGTVLAAVAAAGEDAVLSHRSAAALWGLVDRQRESGRLEITCGRRVRLDGVCAHRHRLDAADRTVRNSVPVTTIERTLLDLAESCDRPTIGRHIDEAVRRGLTTIDRLRRMAARHRRRGRRRDLAFWAAMADRGADYNPGANDWEQRMDRLWDRMGLPSAERQYRIRVSGGRSYRPDRAIVEARIAVDWNGFDNHGSRSGFDADSDRRNRLAAAGWYPLDFTSRSDPELICRTVRAVYEQRMAELHGTGTVRARWPDRTSGQPPRIALTPRTAPTPRTGPRAALAQQTRPPGCRLASPPREPHPGHLQA